MDKPSLCVDNYIILDNLSMLNTSFDLSKRGELGYNITDMPKRTHQPHTRHRARTHGFRARVATKAGRAVIKRRRIKGRAKLTV